MPFPFVIGPAFGVLGWLPDRHQSRRKVRLIVHRAHAIAGVGSGRPVLGDENYYVTVTNASRDRELPDHPGRQGHQVAPAPQRAAVRDGPARLEH